MAIKEIRTLKPSPNDALMDKIRNDMSDDYKSRVPEATQAGVRATSKAIMDYRPNRNEFLDALVNRIGSTIIRNTSWQNPLSEFKQGVLEYGDTIEEIQVGLIKSRTYDPDRDALEKEIWGTHRPEVQSNFHTVNRREYYPITIGEQMLRGAFQTSNGLQNLVSKLMDAPATSDQWDEFLLTCSLFSQYEENGGYYHVNVPDLTHVDADSADARSVAKKVRAMAQNLTFISSQYNAARMPAHVNKDDLVLFGTPEFFATMDVDSLAAAFNMDRATLAGRQIAIPKDKFGMEGTQAILTTKDFFVMADYLLENTSADNPVSLQKNYFLHHHQVISQSRFVPAVMFHTGADDEVINVSVPVTGITPITLTNRDGEEILTTSPGEIYVVTAQATGATAPDSTAVRWSLTGNTDTRTRVTQYGTLHVGPLETSDEIVITATTVWIDPRDPQNTTAFTATVTLSADGVTAPAWPIDHGHVAGEILP